MNATGPHTNRPGSLDALDWDWLRARPGAKWHRVEPDVLPAWVADMDFPVAQPVRDALHRFIDGADIGYPDWPHGSPLRAAFTRRMHERYHWSPDPGQVREFTDLIQALQVVLHLVTEPGDAVAVHTPNYPPFLGTVTRMERRLVPIPMLDTPSGWRFDPEHLAREAAATRCRTLLLVNPHNPTGRVFTRTELQEIADTARRNDMLVISDEIHADLTYPPNQHIPFASLDTDTASRTVTLTSATKAFNLAGTRCALAHLGAESVRAAYDAQPPDIFGAVNTVGVEAALAAWERGGPWLDAVVSHLDDNRRLVADVFAEQLPELGYHLPEAGYLAWLDFRALGLGRDPAAKLREYGRVALSPGPEFGPGGEGFARLNFATSRTVLQNILERLVASIPRIQHETATNP
ncbi:cystathionine beta-lyase [Haloactinospora alba]|uniref:cysteine-S-conjugate beta-lyase n=1 Tax=Haloactinospora alba TaxID=405555 RepID=A0A543NK86_9ACTN|nr:PatB family C-S lyase [Haloactinospora alba]TQN32199.1 cystathionine beta-lyase [Haloactinospora alba]